MIDFYHGGESKLGLDGNLTGLYIGANLFVFTEICIAISESVFIRKKFKKQELEISTNQPIPHRSLVGRAFIKWYTSVTFFSLSISLRSGFGNHIESVSFKIDLVGLVVILLYYLLINICLYRRYWMRIIMSSIILLVSAVLSAVPIITYLRDADSFPDGELATCEAYGGFFHCESILLGVNIFLTAVSAFRLQTYMETKRITAHQVEFFETAVLTIVKPSIILSNVMYPAEFQQLVSVAYPQVAVLLTPLIIEYIQVFFSRMKTAPKMADGKVIYLPWYK